MRLNSNIKGFPLYHVTKDGKVYNIRRNREVTIHPHYRTGRSTKGQHRPGIKQLKCFRNPRSILTKVRYQTLLKCIDDKTKIKALIKAWGISTRSMNRYVHKIKTGYYEA